MAKQALSAGNPALAKTDLGRVATRYPGTPAGAQAAMILAQMTFDEGKFADGLKILEPYQSPSASGPSIGAIWALTGDGRLAGGVLCCWSCQPGCSGGLCPSEAGVRLCLVPETMASQALIWKTSD